jgi:hypothetical protein
MLPGEPDWGIIFHGAQAQPDRATEPGFNRNECGRIEIHETVDCSINPHPDEIAFMIGKPVGQGPPA